MNRVLTLYSTNSCFKKYSINYSKNSYVFKVENTRYILSLKNNTSFKFAIIISEQMNNSQLQRWEFWLFINSHCQHKLCLTGIIWREDVSSCSNYYWSSRRIFNNHNPLITRPPTNRLYCWYTFVKIHRFSSVILCLKYTIRLVFRLISSHSVDFYSYIERVRDEVSNNLHGSDSQRIGVWWGKNGFCPGVNWIQIVTWRCESRRAIVWTESKGDSI